MGSGMGGKHMDHWMAAQRMPGGTLWVFALIGVPFMAYLLASSLRSLWQTGRTGAALATAGCACGPGCTCGPDCSCRVNHAGATVPEPQLVAAGITTPLRPTATAQATSTHSCREVRPVGTTRYRLEALSAFAMNFGMFWMSTGLMVPILPFFGLLAF